MLDPLRRSFAALRLTCFSILPTLLRFAQEDEPRHSRESTLTQVGIAASDDLHVPAVPAEAAVRPELPGRHSEAAAELLAEVVFRFESAPSSDLCDPCIASLEQLCSLLETLLLEEVTEEASGCPVKAPGDVLTRVPHLLSHCLHGERFISLQASADAFEKRS